MDSVRVAEVVIRTYERRDAAGVADVFYRSVREVALSDDTPEQVRAWVPGRWDAEREHRRSGDGRLVLVAADEPGRVAAFIDLEPDGHIDRLFCAPEAAGRGVASRLYNAIETAARAQGIQRLFGCPSTITGWQRLLAKTGREAASCRSPLASHDSSGSRGCPPTPGNEH